MFSVRAEVRASGVYRALGQIVPNIQENLAKFLTAFSVRLSDQIQNNIIELFHSNGRLFNSVYVTRRQGLITASIRDVPYARILEEGGKTSAHVIEPRNVSLLKFEGTNGYGNAQGLVYAKLVNHPGSVFPARPYVGLALTQLRGEFDGGIREIVAKATGVQA